MADLLDLAAHLNGLGARIRANASATAVEVTKAIVNDFGASTPVDTGEAVSNWQVSIEEPMLDIIPAFDSSPKGKMVGRTWTHTIDPAVTRENNTPLMIAAAEAVLEEKTAGQPIYITNNTPQIEELDHGSSAQFPGDFVGRAQIVAQSIIESVDLLK